MYLRATSCALVIFHPGNCSPSLRQAGVRGATGHVASSDNLSGLVKRHPSSAPIGGAATHEACYCALSRLEDILALDGECQY